MNEKHLVFYDGDCPLCNRVVQFLLNQDEEKKFLFAPLTGKTAEQLLQPLKEKDPDLDTLVLLQNFGTPKQQQLIRGKAALRIMWLLGAPYRLLGWLSFLPPFLFDLVYLYIARHRYQLFNSHSKKVDLSLYQDRFLS